ncbi:MAG: hypothetical protein EP348_06900 [Alphaproteobacteria bacterium]|nr:MAG: hypothetical protein EP348_06900 [Alphaproteobacteria bacterium]
MSLDTANLLGAVFQAASFLLLMAIPWTGGRVRLIVSILAVLGLATILIFQFNVGLQMGDTAIGLQLVLHTLVMIVLYFAVSWIVEKLLRAYLLKRRARKMPPPSS